MAKVYSPPVGFDPPEFDINLSYDAYTKLENDYIARLAAEAKKHSSGDLVGEVIRFGVADGHAVYMVWTQKPLALVHVPIGDAWQIPVAHSRGLTITEVRQMVQGSKNLAKLFSKSASS